jgi:hypothetical protein
MEMKKIFIMVSVAVLTLASCGTLTLEQSKVLNNADLASYKTFMIEPADGSTIPSYLSMNDVRNIYRSISGQLYKRGYKYVSTNPDMVVYVAMSVKQVIKTKDLIPPGSGFGYRYFSPRAAYLDSYYSNAQIISGISKEGVLMVDIVDARKNIHVFCAEVSSLAEDSGVNVKDLSKLDQATEVLFSRYPVLPKGN